jgi:hypothetical protein
LGCLFTYVQVARAMILQIVGKGEGSQHLAGAVAGWSSVGIPAVQSVDEHLRGAPGANRWLVNGWPQLSPSEHCTIER